MLLFNLKVILITMIFLSVMRFPIIDQFWRKWRIHQWWVRCCRTWTPRVLRLFFGRRVQYRTPMKTLQGKKGLNSSYNWNNMISSQVWKIFKREIMQLFSIGLYMLNMDGTRLLDPDTNEPISTYDNKNIQTFARAWTGFYRTEVRGNIEEDINNRIDPMSINGYWRDSHPKMDLKNLQNDPKLDAHKRK